MPRCCEHPDCTKYPRYAFTGVRPVLCLAHKLDGMTNVVDRRRCEHPGCSTIASVGPEGGRSVRCVTHKLAGMVNITNKLCQHPGCPTTANYGIDGGPKVYCAKHKLAGMVTKNKKCEHPNCLLHPCFGYDGGKAVRCSQHRLEDMVNVTGRRCEHHGCTTTPVYGPEGGQAVRCAEHKAIDMVNVKDRRCEWPDCAKQPTFGPEGGRPVRCSQHRLDGMIATWGTCEHPDCRKTACFGPENGRAVRCADHAVDGMTNVKNARCAAEWCDTMSARNDGYCARCYAHLFPDQPRARQYKVKEQHFADALQSHVRLPEGFEWVFDKRVTGTDGCGSRRRPDALIDLGTHCIVGELDEHQHNGYSCENKRLMELFNDLGSRPIVFVRMNPDAYVAKDATRVPSAFKADRRTGLLHPDTKEWRRRCDRLCELFQQLVDHAVEHNRRPDKEVTVINLFFDGYDEARVIGA